ncbi:restriction endonuclease subunit S [Mycobacterium sp. SMC-8]|uniref:restriction endonuclease subunit S n=1 Tax=Mycobacterium sp. SMC-8 TaxID=2857060 RepID=UPI0021B41F73|nr:restriction endonuclease subunit S [Mycobacterium sp. SMC-8]UXA10250.1 restriction endonuclease subunit S [Mycobacterium sp. SMC-8]
MSTLVERSLLDLVGFIVDNRGRTCPTAETGMPLIATNCVKSGYREPVFENVRFVDEETYSNWFRAHPEPNDVLFVCKGTPGRVAVVPDPVPFCIAQDMVALRAKPETCNSRYLYYRIRAADVQSRIENMHVGTMIPHFKKGDFGRLRFFVHEDVREQGAIAEVLNALDDKIAANDHLLRLTESLVAAEYASFLSRGSQEVDLGELAIFRNRERIPLSSRQREERKGAVPYYGAAGRLDFVDEAIFDEPLVLVGEDGSVIDDQGHPIVQYIWGPSWVNNHAHVLKGNGVATETLRQSIIRSNVAHLVTGAVQPKISMGNLKTLVLQVPSNVGEFDAIAVRFAAVTRAVTEESVALARTRDELLQLLMSGKVRVNDAEALGSDAL